MPLFAIMVLNLPFSKDRMRKAAFWFAFAFFIVQVLVAIFHHPIFWGYEIEKIDAFFKVSFSVDYMSFIMLLCIGIVSLASLAVARYTIYDEKERFKFINLLIISSMGMSGVVMVKDLFSLYVFLEIIAVSSFIMVAFEKDVLALEGAFKYMILSVIATIFMLLSIALLLLVSGDTSFSAIKTGLKGAGDSRIIIFAISMFLCGLFIKGGLVPFHGWLPDAYTAAPAAVSVLLAGIVTKAAGIYTLIRVVTSLFGFDGPTGSILMALGAISILTGAFAALRQTDFKRMLAYSSISQVGYIILGFGTGSALGMAGAAFHLFTHSIFKSLLIVNSAAVGAKVGTSNMDRMGGLSEKMPITGATSVIGFLSASGMPPLAGFWSKLIIMIALWQSGHYAYFMIAVLASVITLAYFLLMQRKVFFGKLAEGLEGLQEAGPGMLAASCILAAITIGAGVFFPAVFNKFILPVKDLLLK